MGRIFLIFNKCIYFHQLVRHYSDNMQAGELVKHLKKIFNSNTFVLTNSHKMIISDSDILYGSRVFCIMNSYNFNVLKNDNMIQECINIDIDNMCEYDSDIAESDLEADMPDLSNFIVG